MPKKQRLKVVGYPTFVAGRGYPVRVREVHLDRKGNEARITLEHLHKDQEGRIEDVVLTLPIRPSGRTASFFKACGMDTAVGAEIAPDEALGTVVMARFEPSSDGGNWRVAHFEPLAQETPNDPGPE